MDGLFLLLKRVQEDHMTLQQIRNPRRGVRQQEAVQAQLVRQTPRLVGDIDHRHRFGVDAGFA